MGRWNCWTAKACWFSPASFYDFDAEAFLVLSLLTPPEIFNEGLDRLRRMAEAQ